MSVARKILVVSDDTEECETAAVFGALHSRGLGAGLVMLRCARAVGVAGWIGLDNDMRADARDAALIKAKAAADKVEARTGVAPELIVSDDEPVDAIRKLIDADPAISTLVLAAGSGRWGPGPLVARLGRGRALANRPIAVTVVPGGLTDRQMEELGGR